jgi:drug/metabolite transporter (DMT)-like permease
MIAPSGHLRDSYGPLMRWVVPLVALLVMGIAWGGNTALAKVATLAGATPFGLAFLEGVGSGLLVLVLCVFRGSLPRLQRPYLVFYLIAGMTGIAVPASILFWIAPHLPVGIVALIFTTVPLLTYGLSMLFSVERFLWIRALGLLIGLAGTALVVLPSASLPGADAVGWTLIGFTAPALYASQNVYIARYWPRGSDALALACGTLFGGGIVLIPVLIVTNDWMTMLPPWDEAERTAAGMLTINGLGTAIFIWLVRFAGPVFASQTAYLVTTFGIIWGIIIYDEQHSLFVWTACGLLFVGVALVTFGQRLTTSRAGRRAAPPAG